MRKKIIGVTVGTTFNPAKMLADHDKRITRNEKRLTNWEQGITPDPFEVDDSVAYAKTVPTNALPYAAVQMVGGITHRENDTLRSAPVTAVESVGANLTTAQAVYEGADRYAEMVVDGRNCVRFTSGTTTKKTPIAFKPNAQYSVSFYAKSENYGGANTGNHGFTFFYSDGTSSRISIWQNATTWQFYTLTSESGKTVTHIGVTSSEYRAYVYLDIDTFMLNKGTTALPYAPYVKHTLPIPAEVQALDGYGWGVNESVYNYIDYEKKQFVKKLKTLILNGTEVGWVASANSNRYSLTAPSDCMVSLHLRNDVPYVCNHYKTVHYNDRADKTIYMFTGGEHTIQFYDSDFATLADFKAHLAELYASGNPVKIVYPLATPEVTDISDLLSVDNLISVEGGGTIVFENEHGYPVPSEIVYQLKEVTA